MRYAGIRDDYRSNGNALHSMPLLRPAAFVFGPTPQSRMIGALRDALWARPGWARTYAGACAKLGQANRAAPKWRRAAQRDAMRNLNQVRAARRANAKAIVILETALLADGACASDWAQAAAAH